MAACDVSDGPVMSLINKRLRGLRKKYNRILQMEEFIAQGKPINSEQEEVLRTKPSVAASIDELEKLCAPLSAAVFEEISLANQRHQVQSSAIEGNHEVQQHKEEVKASEKSAVEDLLNLLYFSCMFDAKSQTDFTATMLTKTHERGCCLTYDYVTDDDSADLLGETDLDLISKLGNLLISRPVNSSLSHKNALQSCIERAKFWFSNSDQSIEGDLNVTYAGLRAKLNKIMSSDYFITTPEMKAPVEVAAAAAGNYGSFKGPVHGAVVSVSAPVQLESSTGHYQQEEIELANSQGNEDDQDIPVEELQKDESGVENSAEVQAQTEPIRSQDEGQQNVGDVLSEVQQFMPRRKYQNQRGGHGGAGGGHRVGYSNGRGGRRGGIGYRNGHNQYHEQPGNYYSRNYYNSRTRGGRGAAGNFNNGVEVQAGHARAP